jgi:hypothetical protein
MFRIYVHCCRRLEHAQSYCALFSGTVPRDFYLQVFFANLLLLVPRDMPRKNFDFYKFVYCSASLMLLTLTKHALPVPLTPLRNSSAVPSTQLHCKWRFTVLEWFTSVNDTFEKYLKVQTKPTKQALPILVRLEMFAKKPISRKNAYAQMGLMVYFLPADKKLGSVIYTVTQLTILVTC